MNLMGAQCAARDEDFTQPLIGTAGANLLLYLKCGFDGVLRAEAQRDCEIPESLRSWIELALQDRLNLLGRHVAVMRENFSQPRNGLPGFGQLALVGECFLNLVLQYKMSANGKRAEECVFHCPRSGNPGCAVSMHNGTQKLLGVHL